MSWDVATGSQGDGISLTYSDGKANLSLESAVAATDVWKDAAVLHATGGKGMAATLTVRTLTGGAHAYFGVNLGDDGDYRYNAELYAYGDGIFYQVWRRPLSNLGDWEEMAWGAPYRGPTVNRTFLVGTGGTQGTLYFYSSEGGMVELKPNFAFAKTGSSPDWLWWGAGVDDGSTGSIDVSLDNIIEVFD